MLLVPQIHSVAIEQLRSGEKGQIASYQTTDRPDPAAVVMMHHSHKKGAMWCSLIQQAVCTQNTPMDELRKIKRVITREIPEAS